MPSQLVVRIKEPLKVDSGGRVCGVCMNKIGSCEGLFDCTVML